jgi:hypothetical protein
MSGSNLLQERRTPSSAALVRRRTVEVAATVLSLGTNKIFARGSGWLTRNGLTKYVLPTLLLNEAFGAYRAYVAAGALGFW